MSLMSMIEHKYLPGLFGIFIFNSIVCVLVTFYR